MMLDDSTLISPRYEAGRWRSLTFDTEDDWATAVAIATDRFESRYFAPVRAMMRDPLTADTCGFAVLAIDCLLVETLGAFEKGWPNTRYKCGEAIVHILTSSPVFRAHFDTDTAELFVEYVRHGILHQGEVYGDTLVKRGKYPLVERTATGAGLIINRTRFHKALADHFCWYTRQLLSPANDALRVNFRRKMDAICSGDPPKPRTQR